MARRRILAGALAAVAVGVVAPVGAAGQDEPRATAAKLRSVTMKDVALRPATIAIRRNDTVRWLWRDGSIRHDVVWRNGGYKKSRLTASRSTSYRIKFRRRGSFRYLCSAHPVDMRGRVVVR